MRLEQLYQKAIALEPLTLDEGVTLWHRSPLDELLAVAHQVRLKHIPQDRVTWQIDRNINISNLCVAGCTFCNFHSGAGAIPQFLTSEEEYHSKIQDLLQLGGDQVLLQGGLHPKMGLAEYSALFRALKAKFPSVKLHALGPPEILHIAKLERCSPSRVLLELREAGLESLPGAGAEILVDRVRRIVSPRKATAQEWLSVMRTAHRLGMLTSATMMYGHIETITERIQHLLAIRNLQSYKNRDEIGFMAFIAWPFQSRGTRLATKYPIQPVSSVEHLRLVALARVMLHNIAHIQASWLTVGVDTALLSLTGGADDMGSIMIEENVVASTGVKRKMDAEGMQEAIRSAGFTPQLRDQAYQPRQYAPKENSI